MKKHLVKTSTTSDAVTTSGAVTHNPSDPAKMLTADTFAYVLSFCPASMFYAARRMSRQWRDMADSAFFAIFPGGRKRFEEMCVSYGPAYKKGVLNGSLPLNIDKACEAFMKMSSEERNQLLSARCVELLGVHDDAIARYKNYFPSSLDMHCIPGMYIPQENEMNVFYKALFLGLVREEDLTILIFDEAKPRVKCEQISLLSQIIDYSSVKNKVVPYELMHQIWHKGSFPNWQILEQFKLIEEATKKGLLTYDQLKDLDPDHLKSLLFSRNALVALNEGLITIEQFKSIPKEPNLNELFPNLLDSNGSFIFNVGPSTNVLEVLRKGQVTADELSCPDYNNKRQLMTWGKVLFDIEGMSSAISEMLQQHRQRPTDGFSHFKM